MADNHVTGFVADVLLAMQDAEGQHRWEICVECMKDTAVSIKRELFALGASRRRERWAIWVDGVTDRTTVPLLLDVDCVRVVVLLTGQNNSAVIEKLDYARVRNIHAHFRVRPPARAGHD